MIAHLFLRPMLLVPATVAASLLAILVVCCIRGKLPTDWQLLFAKQTTRGVIDQVIHQPGRAGSGKIKPTPARWTYKYHFLSTDGLTHSGECYSFSVARLKKKNAQVVIEFHPRQPHLNRIQGMQSGGQDLITFLAAACLMSIVATSQQLYQVWGCYQLLRSGEPGTATLTHCFPKSSTWELEWSGIKWTRRSKVSEVPWEEFQRRAWQRQREAFDESGRYRGTPQLRGLFGATAALFGAIIFAMLGFAFCLIQFGAPKPWWILGSASGGALGLLLLESRFHLLLRSSNKQQPGDLPAEFQNVRCILQIKTLDDNRQLQFVRTMNLSGNAADARPIEVICPTARPHAAKYIEELGLTCSKTSLGTMIVRAEPAAKRLWALLAMPLVVLLAAAMAVWWI